MHNYDLIVVGGGAAGIMAAISAKRTHPQFKIAIVDRTFALGRKILVCGAGRCNITNINLNKDFSNRYYGATPEFIDATLSQFGYQQIVEFFNELGVELYVERKTQIGKLFPITDQAKTITAVLEDELKRLGIEVFLNTEVTKIDKASGFELQTNNVTDNTPLIFHSSFLILSAGGKTYPALGSNGSGYDLARSLGHQIVDPVPSALPLEGKNSLSQALQGTKMEMEAISLIDGQEIKRSVDDVMFTQYGVSGPAILNISREISIRINREKLAGCAVKLNFFPGKSVAEVKDILRTRWQKRPDQTLELSLFGLFPNKFPAAFLSVVGINKDIVVKDLSTEQIDKLVENFANYQIQITATRGWNEAEFTAGGIDTEQVTPGTLQSKLFPKLYFCGEILNVDGDVGGFNLSWAWASGNVAGQLK